MQVPPDGNHFAAFLYVKYIYYYQSVWQNFLCIILTYMKGTNLLPTDRFFLYRHANNLCIPADDYNYASHPIRQIYLFSSRLAASFMYILTCRIMQMLFYPARWHPFCFFASTRQIHWILTVWQHFVNK